MLSLTAHMQRMARNNQWSNYRLLQACQGLPESEYFAPRQAFFGSIHATLNHIVVVDDIYLGRLRGCESPLLNAQEPYADLVSLAAAQIKTDEELTSYCARLDDMSLERYVDYKRANGQHYREQIGNVLSHLFVHQIHHRGQVHGLLSQTAISPPQLDEFFLDGDFDLRQADLIALGHRR